MTNSDVVIRVESLGKQYSLHHEQAERYTALRDVVAQRAEAVGRLLNPFTLAGQLRKAQRKAAQERAESEEEFWALKDVSFEIRRGERVGIIGRNGAGKSTLLKILSRITEPTTGRVEIRGRVASLLEVGTGFHPELTGRENIYLNGAILGMTRREIRSKFDEIVDFAEVEKFLDMPVKRYSSGMYVRLAFAVAAHLEPEILVVDEVLAVGDANFQQKCLKSLDNLSKIADRTVIFVSHQLPMISSLCSRAILLGNGRITCDSNPASAIIAYQESRRLTSINSNIKTDKHRPSDTRAIFIKAWAENEQKILIDESPLTSSFTIVLVYKLLDIDHGTPYPNMHVYDSQGVCAFVACSNVNFRAQPVRGIYEAKFIIPANMLNAGSYTFGLALTFSLSGMHVSFFQKDEIVLLITEDLDTTPLRISTGYAGPMPGVVRPTLESKIKILNNALS
jgi:lipopolysaccharide transport system ATP-binding protein